MFTKCWDHERIVLYIQDLHAKGEPLNSSAVHREYPTLHRAAFRYFGNWEEAITAAGFDYSEISRYKRWTRKRITDDLRKLHREDVDLSWRQFSMGDHSALAYAAISKRHFGSWEAALEAAGIDYDEIARYNRWTPEKLQARIRACHEQGEDLAAKYVQEREPGLYHAACRQFGSWRRAIESVGLSYHDIAYRIQRSREEVVHILGNLRQKGVNFSDTHMREHFPAVHASAVRHFGKWSDARRTVGDEQNYRQRLNQRSS